MKIFILILMSVLSLSGMAENTRVVGNSFLTNSLVVPIGSQATKLYTVMGQNVSGATAYVQVFNSRTNPAAGTIPSFSFPVLAAPQWYSLDFGYYGADFTSITICISTNATTLGLASTNFTIQAITRSN